MLLVSPGETTPWARDAVRQSLQRSSPPIHKLACGLSDLSEFDGEALKRAEVTAVLSQAWQTLASATDPAASPIADPALIAHLVDKGRNTKEAAQMLCRLARYDVYHSPIVHAGGVAVLTELLFTTELACDATMALVELVAFDESARLGIVHAGGIGPLIQIVKQSKLRLTPTSMGAARILTRLAADRSALRVILLLDGLDAFEHLVRNGSAHERGAARRILRPLYAPAKPDE